MKSKIILMPFYTIKQTISTYQPAVISGSAHHKVGNTVPWKEAVVQYEVVDSCGIVDFRRVKYLL